MFVRIGVGYWVTMHMVLVSEQCRRDNAVLSMLDVDVLTMPSERSATSVLKEILKSERLGAPHDRTAAEFDVSNTLRGRSDTSIVIKVSP